MVVNHALAVVSILGKARAAINHGLSPRVLSSLPHQYEFLLLLVSRVKARAESRSILSNPTCAPTLLRVMHDQMRFVLRAPSLSLLALAKIAVGGRGQIRIS
jgi:hypothetical protein